jgi:beta-lactamase class D
MHYLWASILFIFSFSLYAHQKAIENLYEANRIDGSIAIESADGHSKFQYNVDDKESFVPASTFKIPNTLIILEEGLLKDRFETIAWDGVERGYELWNKDQTLKTAFQYSCVWCYQRYAVKVGDDKYRTYLDKFDYGNLLTGNDISRFWLDGDLKISVKGQIKFLRKLHAGELPIKRQHIETLKDIMLSENQENLKVWSKTGWSGKDGWYVGYLSIDEQIWFFANHINIKKNTDLAFRKKLTMEAFRILKIIQ